MEGQDVTREGEARRCYTSVLSYTPEQIVAAPRWRLPYVAFSKRACGRPLEGADVECVECQAVRSRGEALDDPNVIRMVANYRKAQEERMSKADEDEEYLRTRRRVRDEAQALGRHEDEVARSDREIAAYDRQHAAEREAEVAEVAQRVWADFASAGLSGVAASEGLGRPHAVASEVADMADALLVEWKARFGLPADRVAARDGSEAAERDLEIVDREAGERQGQEAVALLVEATDLMTRLALVVVGPAKVRIGDSVVLERLIAICAKHFGVVSEEI